MCRSVPKNGSPCGIANKRRWRFQYSLRTLFLVMLIASMAGAVLATKLKAIRSEQRAKHLIERFGGHVRYGYDEKWTWLESVLGAEAVPHDTFVDLMSCRVTDEALVCLGDFERLYILNLTNTPVDDDDLRNISRLRDLHYLSLTGTAVSSAGLSHLQTLVHLEVLHLDKTHVTDEGCTTISTMSALKHVILERTEVTDAGKTMLRRLRPDVEIGEPCAGGFIVVRRHP